MISFVFDLFKSHLNSFDSVPMLGTIAFKNKLLSQPDPKTLSILYHFFTSCFLLLAFLSGLTALPVIGGKEVLCCKTITLSEWYQQCQVLDKTSSCLFFELQNIDSRQGLYPTEQSIDFIKIQNYCYSSVSYPYRPGIDTLYLRSNSQLSDWLFKLNIWEKKEKNNQAKEQKTFPKGEIVEEEARAKIGPLREKKIKSQAQKEDLKSSPLFKRRNSHLCQISQQIRRWVRFQQSQAGQVETIKPTLVQQLNQMSQKQRFPTQLRTSSDKLKTPSACKAEELFNKASPQDQFGKIKKQEQQFYSGKHYNRKSPNNYKIPQRAAYKESQACPLVILVCTTRENSSSPQEMPEKKQLSSPAQGRTYSVNEGKNVAKNFGKAIVSFFMKNKKTLRLLCKESCCSYQRFLEELPELRDVMSTVVGFKRAWTEHKYASAIRRASNFFLRKAGLSYIFNSKINNLATHIKFRKKFLDALTEPEQFDRLKDY